MPTLRQDIKIPVKSNLQKLDNFDLRVGWFSSAKYQADVPVAGVAAVHELGSKKKRIPKRPFIAPTIEDQSSTWGEDFGRGAAAVLSGKLDTKSMADQMGLKIAGQIRKTISKIQEPPLSSATVQARLKRLADQKTIGSLNKPLVDTKTMFNSLSHELIEKKGGGE